MKNYTPLNPKLSWWYRLTGKFLSFSLGFFVFMFIIWICYVAGKGQL